MSRLREEVIGSPRTLPHVLIPLQIACEVDHILLVIAAAYCECIIVEEMQDANAIADRSTYTEINHPAAVIDKEGNILLWYLLDVFGQAYQVVKLNGASRTLLTIRSGRDLEFVGQPQYPTCAEHEVQWGRQLVARFKPFSQSHRS
ncbi:hypothetical protein M404DRAFT_32183 [Pisolithus tinctorius Marx 270]|uniref:Uncharacterized protein n=1 Tax=Pisolithus tinctorius Marx 270 TaxID=870435 RepID=A0A0C3NPQ9_PISTI|nr:hypothetical protein M404DRAFT_32183 [Pisolithus tinctorius Marx 270]